MELVRADDDGVLPRVEGLLLDVGVELVAPPKAAALAGAAPDMVGDLGPVLGAVQADEGAEQVVLLRSDPTTAAAGQ